MQLNQALKQDQMHNDQAARLREMVQAKDNEQAEACRKSLPKMWREQSPGSNPSTSHI